MNPAYDILLIFLLLLANGVFAMTEIAIVSSKRAVLLAKAENGHKGAKLALSLAENPSKFLSTVQVGITLVSIVSGVFGGARLSNQLAQVLIPIPFIGVYAETLAFLVVIGSLTYFSLIIGELVPKSLAMRYPETIACAMARPMSALAYWTSPLIKILSCSTSTLLRLFGVKEDKESRMSREEFTVLLREGLVAGSIDDSESRMMEGVFSFEKLDVYDIMIPRPKMQWIDLCARHEDVWPQIIRSTQGFFPVYENQRDNILGVVSVKDMYAQLAAGAEIRFRDLMHEPLLVPETQKARVLLENFRNTGNHAAFVVNEFGGVVGMVTLLDLMESIVGDVPSREERMTSPIRERGDGSWLMDGLFEIEKLERHLKDFVPPVGSGDEFQTVAGWFSHELSRVPTEGDMLEKSGWKFEIMDMDGSRVDKILAVPIPTNIMRESAKDSS